MVGKETKVLMFSLGLNHYQQMYQRCINSHRHYAKTQGYDYQLFNSNRQASITASAWVKIPLILAALNQGYDRVFYIDADCEIKVDTPAIESLIVPGKLLYMSQGFSGHINSGVMIVHNDERVKALFERILASCNQDVPSSDWGENGHMIHFAEHWAHLQLLDSRWNNNAQPALPDYIRHFSAGGPMRPLYQPNWSERSFRLMQSVRNRFNFRKYLARQHTAVAIQNLLLQLRPAILCAVKFSEQTSHHSWLTAEKNRKLHHVKYISSKTNNNSSSLARVAINLQIPSDGGVGNHQTVCF